MTEFETAFLELYTQQSARLQAWTKDVARLAALEVGAKMRDQVSTTSTNQRANVLDNAKWVYTQATGQVW